MVTEDQLEQLCLGWFREGGYEYANGYDIAHDMVNGEAREGTLGYGEAPGQEDYKQVLLTGQLLYALQRINPHISRTTLKEQFVHVMSKSEAVA